MTAITLPNVGLHAGFLDAEHGWGVTMNRNQRVLDALVNLRVEDKDLTEPPLASSGAAYIVGPAATGAWAGYDGQLAIWMQGDDLPDGQWAFVQPKESWRAWLIDENAFYQYVSGTWVIDSTSSVTPTEFTQLIGDGSAANFFIDHALGTRNVAVTVYRNASPWDDIVVDVTRPSENQVELSGFALAPSVDEYMVVVRKR